MIFSKITQTCYENLYESSKYGQHPDELGVQQPGPASQYHKDHNNLILFAHKLFSLRLDREYKTKKQISIDSEFLKKVLIP